MNIGEVSALTGLTRKTVRFYSDKGLIHPLHRKENGYRSYDKQHISELNLIRQARLVGFSLEECQELVLLAQNPQRRSAEVKKKAQEKLKEIEIKLRELQNIQHVLSVLANQCPGDDDANCPILSGLCGDTPLV
jgi:MerR family copper efflux transcriptional regulator